MESALISGLGVNNYVSRYGDTQYMLANPAGIATNKNTQISTTYENRFSGNMQNGSMAFGLLNYGMDFDFSSVPGIEERDETGAKTGDLTLNEWKGAVSGGWSITDSLDIGARFKGNSKSIGGVAASGIGLNIGGIYKFGKFFSLGLVAEDLFGWEGGLDDGKTGNIIPATFRIGAHINPMDDLFISSGASIKDGKSESFGVGAEYTFSKILTARVGYDSAYRSFGALSAGIGVNIQDFIKIDYAFRAHDELGYNNMVTLTYAFKEEPKKPEPTPVATLVPTPVATPEPVRVSFGEDKYLKLTGGSVMFKLGKSSMSDLTEDGQRSLENVRTLLQNLYSLGLCDVKVIVTGNASAEGSLSENMTLSALRANQGVKFLKDALKGIVDFKPTDIRPIGQGDTLSKKLEGQYISEYRAAYGKMPSKEDIEAFRQSCRNFEIRISIDIEKWQDIRSNQDTIRVIDSLSPGLSSKFEDYYQATLKKHKK
jgi:hypothetical protein